MTFYRCIYPLFPIYSANFTQRRGGILGEPSHFGSAGIWFKDPEAVRKMVTFFNASHGQLELVAAEKGLTPSLKTNAESRFYALILHKRSESRNINLP